MITKVFKLSKLIPISILMVMYSCSTNKKAVSEFDDTVSSVVVEEVVTPLGVGYLIAEQIEPKIVWKLNKMKDIPATDLFDKVPTLSFDNIESRVQGNAGCNRYSGSYSIDGNKLTISRIATTRMMCNNKNDEFGFTKTLESVNAAKVDGDKLVFLKDKEVVLEFVKE